MKPGISVQSYINGRPANCTVVCWNGKVLAGIGVEVVRTIGQTGPATVVEVVDSPSMMHAAEQIAGRLKLCGFFGLDFMIETGSGSIYLIEINPRPTRISCLQLGNGRDPVGAMSAHLSNRPIQERASATQKKLIAFFPDASKYNSELLESSFYDAPQGEPQLVEDLLNPWHCSGFLYRLVNVVERMKLFALSSDTSRSWEVDPGCKRLNTCLQPEK